MDSPYLFESQRLSFRTWRPSDLPAFTAMNADKETMTFFQHPLSKQESQALMDRMTKLYDELGHCYFAVDLVESGEFLGMIGLGTKSFQAPFTPCVDIGWRIRKKFWNQGYTTEGATRCLEFAKVLGVKEVFSLASAKNLASIRVMQKIGMNYAYDFQHPDLLEHPRLQPCSLYKIAF
ncbi:Protein N-acetyltransferase, RimJ/RimL family [Algoriphagus locisalis]|uniref:Protein N-acetyltransferase, RimJ/RimL family n=1 Tax=Algoriphagus locisalis TaxID=305507 RepID=A0A1I7BLI3_9BACT|nr:GNAT family N-acetyltransferase [Algoriphagus locisalis]SFT88039.1 Protein N-acetyltransferase, RimJ/RimL family [Algoriphagus locisalis]